MKGGLDKKHYKGGVEKKEADDITDHLDKLKIDILSDEVLSNLENKDFLRLDRNKRLAYITKGEGDIISRMNSYYSDISLGKIKYIEFTFTFGKKFNERLYLRTTAGQVLPPEVQTVTTQDNHIWVRNGLYGEFFDDKGNRLIIGEGTKLNITKSFSKEEIEKQQTEFERESSKYGENKDIALESLKRGLDPKVSISLFANRLTGLSIDSRKVEIEMLITELERVKDYFVDDFHNETLGNGKINKEFLAYFLNFLSYPQVDKERIFTELGFDKTILEKYKRKEIKLYNWETLGDDEKRKIIANISKIPKEFTEQSFGTQFVPGTNKTKELFMYACNTAGLPIEWANNESLHKLLQKESAGRVGVMNYTFKKTSENQFNKFKDYVTEHLGEKSGTISGNLGIVSNATGLGQMLISNVDEFYPILEGMKSKRDGIGIPLCEAVGMLNYINDRYGSVDIAFEMHGKKGSYNHPTKGKMYKKFEEGY